MMSFEDKFAIQEVMAQYSYTYDARDAEGFAALFTEDAVWERFAAGATRPEIRLTSQAAIRAWAAQRLQERSGRCTSRHYQSGVLFDELTAAVGPHPDHGAYHAPGCHRVGAAPDGSGCVSRPVAQDA